MTVIKVAKNLKFLEASFSMKPTIFFGFFTCTTQNKSGTTEWPVVERRQDQHEVRHVLSIGSLFFY